MKKPTFEEFLHNIYSMSLFDYQNLSKEQAKAVEIDYKDRYGAPIKWF